MKKVSVLFFLVLLPAVLFAVNVVSSGTKEVSAYKRSYTETIPDSVYVVRVIDSDSIEVSDDVVINVPESSRRADFQAFAWIVSGNIYGTVTVDLTFSPMYWEKDTEKGMIIPYDVSLTHISSRVGNTMIPVGRYPTDSAIAMNNSFTDYDYNYCDDISFYEGAVPIPSTAISDYSCSTASKVRVSSSSKTITVKYDITKYTKIYENGSEIASYPYQVCDYWNRKGNAYVNLAITDDSTTVGDNPKLYDNGMYYANVMVTVTKN